MQLEAVIRLMELLFNNNHHYLFKLWGFYSVHGNQSPLSCDLSLLFFILSMGTPFYGHSSLSAAKRKKGNAVGLHDGALKKIIIKNDGIPISICSTLQLHATTAAKDPKARFSLNLK